MQKHVGSWPWFLHPSAELTSAHSIWPVAMTVKELGSASAILAQHARHCSVWGFRAAQPLFTCAGPPIKL